MMLKRVYAMNAGLVPLVKPNEENRPGGVAHGGEQPEVEQHLRLHDDQVLQRVAELPVPCAHSHAYTSASCS